FRSTVAVQPVATAEIVVVDGVPVPARDVREDSDDLVGAVMAGASGGDRGGGTGAPAAGDEGVAGQAAARVDCLRSNEPVDLVECLGVNRGRVEAAAQPTHDPVPGGLAENGRRGRVHSHDPCLGPVLAKLRCDAPAVPAGADAA